MRYVHFVIIFLLAPLLPEVALYIAGLKLQWCVFAAAALTAYKMLLIVTLTRVLGWQDYTLTFIVGVVLLLLFLWIFVGWILLQRRSTNLKGSAFILLVILSVSLQALAIYARNLSDWPRYRFFYIPTESMEPLLFPGDSIAVDLVFSRQSIKRGDVIVFKYEDSSRVYVKRVLGLPGERIKVREDLFLSANYSESLAAKPVAHSLDGLEIFELNQLKASYRLQMGYKDPLYFRNRQANWPRQGEFNIPDDHFFMLGDNRSRSDDSRVIGVVRRSNIIGVVRGVAWHHSKRVGFDNNRFISPLQYLSLH